MRFGIIAIIIGLFTCTFAHVVLADPPAGDPTTIEGFGGGDGLAGITELDWTYYEYLGVGDEAVESAYTNDGVNWIIGGCFYSQTLQEEVDIVGTGYFLEDGDFITSIYYVSDSDKSNIPLDSLGW